MISRLSNFAAIMGQCHEIIVQTKGYILICVVTIIFEWTPQFKIQYGTNCKIASQCCGADFRRAETISAPSQLTLQGSSAGIRFFVLFVVSHQFLLFFH